MGISRRKNLLEIMMGDNETYQLKYLQDELPPSLNAKISGHTLSMDLKEAEEYAHYKFRRKWFK